MSVLATSLYQHLPPDDDVDMQHLPGQGRKLLSFADSRQDAAFFAPYLERTYTQLLRRRLIFKTVSTDQTGHLRIDDLVGRLLKQAESIGLFTQAQSHDKRKTLMKTWLMQELIAWDRSISLEGLGLVRFRLVRPEKWFAPPPLLSAPWNLSKDEAWQLLEILLNTLRQQGTLTYLEGVDPRDDVFKPRNRALYIRQAIAESKNGIFSWLPTKGSNRRLDILLKLLTKNSAPLPSHIALAHQTLSNLWNHLTTDIWRDHLPAENLGKLKGGAVHRLSHLFWEVVPIKEPENECFRCNHCHNIFHTNLRGICPTYKCAGQLEPLDTNSPHWQQNHYRYLYQNMATIPFSAKEHTAQWTGEEAAKVQEEFIRGELNALSCSTTFELGVDVGELQAVLMRNVPPTTANYVQRAGRAGRRTDAAAFALTYAQRRSHDLTYYAEPQRMIAGKIKPPVVVVNNEIIVRRHLHSVLFAAFFRWAKQTYGRTFGKVGEFFAPEGVASAPELLQQFVSQRPQVVTEALYRIVPPELQQELGLANWAWVSKFTNEQNTGVLDKARLEVTNDLTEFANAEQQALKETQEAKNQAEKYKQVEKYKFFMRVAETIRKRDLLGFLGSRNVLPKYGFPTDVVELHTNHLPNGQRIELQRDLRIAIAEYAPGSEVVAAGKVWVSSGLYRHPSRAWIEHHYAICATCGHFHSANFDNDICSVCGGKLRDKRHRYGTFIIPEFGFIVGELPKEAGEARPERTYATQVYFAKYNPPDYTNTETNITETPEPELKQVEGFPNSPIGIWQRYSRYGKLSLVNTGIAGQGFEVCMWCGFARPRPTQFAKKEKKHKHPRTGNDCTGFLKSYHLGHEFITDVLELQFTGGLRLSAAENLWWSVLYALLEGASESLGIRRDDLDGTLYRQQNSPIPSLILFDNVPGGAGHVQRIAKELPSTFQEALTRVSKDCCGAETSCYECLRNFRNQSYHDQLQRGLARDFLKNLLNVEQASCLSC